MALYFQNSPVQRFPFIGKLKFKNYSKIHVIFTEMLSKEHINISGLKDSIVCSYGIKQIKYKAYSLKLCILKIFFSKVKKNYTSIIFVNFFFNFIVIYELF